MVERIKSSEASRAGRLRQARREQTTLASTHEEGGGGGGGQKEVSEKGGRIGNDRRRGGAMCRWGEESISQRSVAIAEGSGGLEKRGEVGNEGGGCRRKSIGGIEVVTIGGGRNEIGLQVASLQATLQQGVVRRRGVGVGVEVGDEVFVLLW